ncbi:uncharacterized protein LOC123409839 isoform X2 [Hordeum vulgare subsp. vulgare]|uniref:uncharacterized protein LOC123409839 isoform X2 n=1 Tax=Hordeum vulgare subsp. vulgare TaxID=112509 RepID=UPI001D1A37CC|nr:uncharacterized protein LOC123409839 isoform X2 [Hordeum vulgare subsp. vulgare]
MSAVKPDTSGDHRAAASCLAPQPRAPSRRPLAMSPENRRQQPEHHCGARAASHGSPDLLRPCPDSSAATWIGAAAGRIRLSRGRSASSRRLSSCSSPRRRPGRSRHGLLPREEHGRTTLSRRHHGSPPPAWACRQPISPKPAQHHAPHQVGRPIPARWHPRPSSTASPNRPTSPRMGRAHGLIYLHP